MKELFVSLFVSGALGFTAASVVYAAALFFYEFYKLKFPKEKWKTPQERKEQEDEVNHRFILLAMHIALLCLMLRPSPF